MFTEEERAKFRQRFAAWKKGKKPYLNGKVVLNNYTNAEFNDDGTFTDDTTRVFDDFYVTPSGVKTKYGSYTDKNWDRYKQQERFFKTHDQQTGKLRYEPGLEIVSPEFDIISGIRGLLQMLTPKKQIEHIDFDRFRTAVAKLKSDDDAWRAAHPEMEIENVLKKPQLPNVYESFPPELIHDVAKDPYYNLLLNAKTSADVAKISPTVRSYAGIGFDNSFDRAYTNLKLFLQSPAYRKRLENYYKLKGSSSVTINHAPDDRIGELLYNIETAKATVRPPGHLVDENGAVKDAFGLYDPNSHSIQVAVDALGRLTPEHEMWHAARKARTYLDNGKYKMRVKSASDPIYYGDMTEQEVRVLDTLREMQEAGLDINNLTDDQIWDFLMDTPIDTHGTNVQSLIDNYWYDDIKNALRNFKTVIYPLGFGGVGYGSYNKYAE